MLRNVNVGIDKRRQQKAARLRNRVGGRAELRCDRGPCAARNDASLAVPQDAAVGEVADRTVGLWIEQRSAHGLDGHRLVPIARK